MDFEPGHDASVRLLVSVRDAEEAEAALAGGADLIDIKEPRLGSLGKAADTSIAEIVKQVAGRRPLSAALGELADWDDSTRLQIDPAVRLLKIGLAYLGSRSDWRKRLEAFRLKISESTCGGLVFAAYADWRRAEAPSVEQIAELALGSNAQAFLIDTWRKDGTTLLDWITMETLAAICDRFRRHGIPVALAGSLGPGQIRALSAMRPTWLAVRGAACIGGRDGTIDSERVRNLAAELKNQPHREEAP
jgi:uncharacterized protein (UPF0264 family)